MENTPIEQSVSEEEQGKNIKLPMGHRSSKSAIGNPTSNADSYRSQTITSPTTVTSTSVAGARSGININRIPIPLPGTTINVQIQESSVDNGGAIVASSNTQLSESESSSLTSIAGNSLQNRQIIIKIQLAKMENGNERQMTSTTQRGDADESPAIDFAGGSVVVDRDNLETLTTNNSTQFVNLTLNGNFIYTDDGTNDLVSLSSDSNRAGRTAGGCTSLMNNNINDFSGRLNALKIQEDWEQQQISDTTPEYCEVLDDTVENSSTTNSLGTSNEFRRSDSSLADAVGCLNGARRSKTIRTGLSSSGLSRRRCRDAFRRILEPSTKKSLNKCKKQNKKHSETTPTLTDSSNTVFPSSSSQSHLTYTASQIQQKPTSVTSNAPSMSVSMTTAASSSNNVIPISIATVSAAASSNSINPTNHVSATIWTPSQNDLIIPISSPPQFVVVQCPPTSVVTLGRIDYNSIRLSSTEITHAETNNVNGLISHNVPTESLVKQVHIGPIVHSQVDFVHCLVPDLEKIINSSFYWGKIDRYEAERLLEGKPEGTFLLRDSAQEEYLFSVTFRKFGRSLHARIEQSGHKFGFDCHDPSVFTAPTVTGLLQHYKDPTSVMFFEPMLTIPLHRKTTFSLQELARGVIVTNTTYDGINELGLPLRLREFLKEYYYKQKLRVKPFDKMVYSCS